MSKNYCISALKPLNIYIFSNGLLLIEKIYDFKKLPKIHHFIDYLTK